MHNLTSTDLYNIPPLAILNGELSTVVHKLYPTVLISNGRIFLLKKPLECTLDIDEGYWFAKNTELDIEVFSDNINDSQKEFAAAFNELYEIYCLSNIKLNSGAKLLKNQIESFILGVYETKKN